MITGDALDEHPELPSVWRAVHAQAVDEINAAPDAYNQFTATAQGIDVAVMQEINVVEPDGTFAQYPRDPFTANGRKLLEGTKKFLVDNGWPSRTSHSTTGSYRSDLRRSRDPTDTARTGCYRCHRGADQRSMRSSIGTNAAAFRGSGCGASGELAFEVGEHRREGA